MSRWIVRWGSRFLGLAVALLGYDHVTFEQTDRLTMTLVAWSDDA